MIETLEIKLLPIEEQKIYLLDTIKQYNLACNYISQIAFENKTHSKVKLQKIAYYEVRDKYSLYSQMAIRAIGAVSELYKKDMSIVHIFEEQAPMMLDSKLLSFSSLDEASILTVHGRINVSIVINGYHKENLFGNRLRGQADMVLIDDVFYLFVSVENKD